MTVVHDDSLVTLHLGDCLAVMAEMEPDSVDAIVTDPPYGLTFMGKGWDDLGKVPEHTGPQWGGYGWHGTGTTPPNVMQRWHEAWAREAFRVAKPGAHLLAFGGTRTVHRLAAAIEDAGWEIRDMLIWGYSSGFPKSLNVSDRLAEAVPEDARCACEPRSTRTALGSQDGYRPERGSGDGQPLPAGDGDLEPAPSPADAPERIRGDQLWDDLGLALARSLAPATIGRPASEGSPLLASPLSAGSPASDSEASGKASSTSAASQPGSRRRASRTQHTPGSDGASSEPAWSPPHGDTFPYSKCTSCGRWQVADGYGTALKPAFEPIVMARKPLRGTVAGNVTELGTGALNIDATRIGHASEADAASHKANSEPWTRHERGDSFLAESKGMHTPGRVTPVVDTSKGRWPANVLLTSPIFDGGVEGVVGGGDGGGGFGTRGNGDATSWDKPGHGEPVGYGDSGTYSRFFLIPKSSRSDREPLTRDEAYRLHRESGACDKLPAWRRPDPSPSDPTDSSLPARAISDEPSTESSSSATSLPGKPPTGRSQRATRSTTSTGTSRTTGSATFSSSIPSPTNGSIPAASSAMGNGGSPATSAESSSLWEPLTGTSPEKDGRSTDDADPATSARWSSRNSCGDCGKPLPRVSTHPTQKPTDLMRHLVRLVTPPGGTVLDCFLGSGTTAIAANAEGFRCIGIEKEREYLDIALARMAHQPLGLAL